MQYLYTVCLSNLSIIHERSNNMMQRWYDYDVSLVGKKVVNKFLADRNEVHLIVLRHGYWSWKCRIMEQKQYPLGKD